MSGKEGAMRTKTGLRVGAISLLLAIAVPGALQVRAQSNETKRQPKHLVMPTVPELAKKLNLTGTVRIEVTIGADGNVKRSRVVGGHPLLVMAAEPAAQKSTFEPGPTETSEILEFKF
jgi:TonB family protein